MVDYNIKGRLETEASKQARKGPNERFGLLVKVKIMQQL